MMKSSRLYHMVLAGVLCAVGIVVPMFMPRIVLGPMLCFFLTAPAIIALRRASHIVFAGLGALYLKKYPDTIDRPVASTVFNFVIALLHAAAEMIVVAPFFLSGALFTPEQLANGFVTSVVLLVGLGTLIHSMLDYSISILIWKPVSLAVPRSTKA